MENYSDLLNDFRNFNEILRKNQGFTLSLEDASSEKLQGGQSDTTQAV